MNRIASAQMSRAFIAAAGVFVLAAVAGCAFSPHPLTGQQAPDFSLELLGGGALDLAEQRGEHIVILDFWASWCGPCRRYMPIVERVAGEFKDQDVVLYAVNSGEDPNTIRNFLRTFTVQSPIALDMSSEVSRLYQADSIPQTVIIDKQGRVQKVYVGVGRNSESELRSDLRRLVSGEDLTPPAAPGG